jgi:hypothetical protein
MIISSLIFSLFHAGPICTQNRFFGLTGREPRWGEKFVCDSVLEETKSLPIGPVMASNEYFAGERLGFSCFGAMAWTGPKVEWVFLVSRILEKTSAYAAACYQKVYQLKAKPTTRSFVQWSDGPKQLKSGEMLGSCVSRFKEFKLKHMAFEYGCPGHWKGPWDQMFGIMANVLRLQAMSTRLETVEDVVTCMNLWAHNQHMKLPDGPTYTFLDFYPGPKKDQDRASFASHSVFGFDGLSWSFTKNDERRTCLHGRGANWFNFTGLDGKSHALTGIGSSKERTGYPSMNPKMEEVPDEAGDDELFLTTKMYEGWRTSYTKTLEGAQERRRLHLARLAEAQPESVLRLPEAARFRSDKEKLASAIATKANRAMVSKGT